MRVREVTWQTLVLERIIATLEFMGYKSLTVSWGFNCADPWVAIKTIPKDSVTRLAHIDGVSAAEYIDGSIYCRIQRPLNKEMHVEGRTDFSAKI